MSMAMLKGLPATEPSMDGIQAGLGLAGYTDYAVLMRPDLYGPQKDIVNFWARFQPMHDKKIGKLTDGERMANAYGLVDNENFELFDFTDVNRAFNNAQGGEYSFIRLKPTGDIKVSPYRPWDYYSEDGTLSYDNEAISPIEFEVEGVLDQGKANISVRALDESELDAEVNITLADLIALGGGGVISKDENTCFGLLYKKNGGQVEVLGGYGEYPAFIEGVSDTIYRPQSLELVGDGDYEVVFIILNTETQRFVTWPEAFRTFTVTSVNAPTGLLSISGGYYFNTDGTIMTVTELTLTTQDAPAVAGNIALYICPLGTLFQDVEASALYTTSKSYDNIEQGSSYTFPDFNINVSEWDTNRIELWVTTTTASGVYKSQLEYIDNSDDIQ